MPYYRTNFSMRVANYLRKLTLLDGVLFLGTLCIVVWLKLSLTLSAPAELAWILSPTMYMVKAFTGMQFFFDPAKGYINNETAVVIGTSCSGVNYLIIALCMTLFSFVPRFTGQKLPVCAVLILAAYIVTVMVNSFRIIGSIALLHAARQFKFVITDSVHEAIGIFVYFSFLVLYYASLQALIGRRGESNQGAV